MKTIIRENTWLTRGFTDFGWGNGYVLIPEGHPLHGEFYDDIDVDVHCGLTFSKLVDERMIKEWHLEEKDKGKWCVGFDTAHARDNLFVWSKEAVQKETDRLMEQIASYEVVQQQLQITLVLYTEWEFRNMKFGDVGQAHFA